MSSQNISAQTSVNEKKQTKKSSIWHWRLDQDELNKQVEGYNTLGYLESRRKRSALLLVLSAVITILLNQWLGIYDASSVYTEIAIFLILATFIWYGNRTALIIAMIVWTLEKGLQLVGMFSADKPSGIQGYVAIVWWAWYMSEFMAAYQVEKARRAKKSL